MNTLRELLGNNLPPRQVMDEGICSQTFPDTFFPDKGEKPDDAKRICSMCPVEEICRDWAVATRQEWGVWGGTTERERKRLRGTRRAAA